MKINRIDHISIAVNNLQEARKKWEPILGKTEPDETYIDEPEKIHVARYWIGEVGLELMESTDPEGEVAKFVVRYGEGIMLIGLNVDNTRESIAELKAQGYPFVSEIKPFRQSEYAFLNPKAVNGVLMELIDDKSKDSL